jgi:hypothetical protein
MLQLPTATPARFTKAQVAEITRGGKARVSRKAKTDPIIAAIRRADQIIDRYIEAVNELSLARRSLNERDRGFVNVPPVDETPIFREFGHGFVFTSEAHVVRMFRIRRRHARQRLAQDRAQLMAAEIKGSPLLLEHRQRVVAEKRLIAALLKFEPAQRRAVRKECQRLGKLQKVAGLLDARKKHMAALRDIRLVTQSIAKMKPTTPAGAVAVVQYVRKRLFPDRQHLFFNETGTDGAFWHLLQHAHKILERML